MFAREQGQFLSLGAPNIYHGIQCSRESSASAGWSIFWRPNIISDLSQPSENNVIEAASQQEAHNWILKIKIIKKNKKTYSVY